ncbi:hypothetical protein PY257_00650 [Ramlibacter sp. H39-3-26]|uniref:hypothetical protein n=1 Tax=Curvibacter soli TaxID=3031331 RepID=UPI0023DB28F6|nr:hypothetical protein [Ramlibacter sp. H39-3-26]MDF1483715.1 hypothetical protein [Ramlibacter sp. H39-3-26]
MTHKTIPLDAVRNALMCAVIKQKTAGREVGGKPMGRVAAYTYYAPFTSVTCRNVQRGKRYKEIPGMNFGVMHCGDIDRLIDRINRNEVRRTWGVGIRALRADIAGGVMR